MDEYARENNTMVKYSSNNSTHLTKPAQLLVRCSRGGKQPPKKSLLPGHQHRNRSSVRCGCPWYVRFLQDKETCIWTVSRSFMIHKKPCQPSKSQVALIERKRGTKLSKQLLDELRHCIGFQPKTEQLRSWVIDHHLPINVDSVSLRNLWQRVVWYDLVS